MKFNIGVQLNEFHQMYTSMYQKPDQEIESLHLALKRSPSTPSHLPYPFEDDHRADFQHCGLASCTSCDIYINEFSMFSVTSFFFLSLAILFVRLICVATWLSLTHSHFYTLHTQCVDRCNVFIHFIVHEHLGCFQYLAFTKMLL